MNTNPSPDYRGYVARCALEGLTPFSLPAWQLCRIPLTEASMRAASLGTQRQAIASHYKMMWDQP